MIKKLLLTLACFGLIGVSAKAAPTTYKKRLDECGANKSRVTLASKKFIAGSGLYIKYSQKYKDLFQKVHGGGYTTEEIRSNDYKAKLASQLAADTKKVYAPLGAKYCAIIQSFKKHCAKDTNYSKQHLVNLLKELTNYEIRMKPIVKSSSSLQNKLKGKIQKLKDDLQFRAFKKKCSESNSCDFVALEKAIKETDKEAKALKKLIADTKKLLASLSKKDRVIANFKSKLKTHIANYNATVKLMRADLTPVRK